MVCNYLQGISNYLFNYLQGIFLSELTPKVTNEFP